MFVFFSSFILHENRRREWDTFYVDPSLLVQPAILEHICRMCCRSVSNRLHLLSFLLSAATWCFIFSNEAAKLYAPPQHLLNAPIPLFINKCYCKLWIISFPPRHRVARTPPHDSKEEMKWGGGRVMSWEAKLNEGKKNYTMIIYGGVKVRKRPNSSGALCCMTEMFLYVFYPTESAVQLSFFLSFFWI